jgi:hypothetical protein
MHVSSCSSRYNYTRQVAVISSHKLSLWSSQWEVCIFKLVLQSPPSPIKSYLYAVQPPIPSLYLSNSSGLWHTHSGNWLYRIPQVLQCVRLNRWKQCLWKSKLKIRTVIFSPWNCKQGLHFFYVDKHTHRKALWFKLLGACVKGMADPRPTITKFFLGSTHIIPLVYVKETNQQWHSHCLPWLGYSFVSE